MPESERTTTRVQDRPLRVDSAGFAVGSGDGMSGNLLQRKLVRPIIDLLKQGVTPEKMALSLALGAALGIFPVLGSTTALCAIAALAFGLNLPAIQIVNYFVYPAQIALLIPFFRLGERMFRAPHLAISVPQIYAMLHENVWSVMRLLGTTTWHAIVVWSLAAPLIVTVIYFPLAPLLRRVLRRQMTSAVEQA